MATSRPDPGDFLDLAQRMLRQLFAETRSDDEPWAEATRRPLEHAEATERSRGPGPERQRENLTFALATRAVEALEDLVLNVAAIRQRLERMDSLPGAPSEDEARAAPTEPGSDGPEP